MEGELSGVRGARWFPVLCLAGGLLLAACSGGGGGSAPEPPAPPDPDPSPSEPPPPDPSPSEPPPPDPSPPDPPDPPAPPDPPPSPPPEPRAPPGSPWAPIPDLNVDDIQVDSPTPAPDPSPPSAPAPPDPDPSPTDPPPLPTAADFRSDPEYYARDDEGRSLNWGLDAVGAAEAYARLAARERQRAGTAEVDAANAAARPAQSGGAFVAPGTGVTVGLIDTGIEERHWEFDRSRVTETILTGTGDRGGDSYSHGTAVASLVAARRGGTVPSGVQQFDFHGIAWGADLKMFAANLLNVMATES